MLQGKSNLKEQKTNTGYYGIQCGPLTISMPFNFHICLRIRTVDI